MAVSCIPRVLVVGLERLESVQEEEPGLSAIRQRVSDMSSESGLSSILSTQ